MASPQLHYVLKFQTNLGKVSTIKIPRANDNKTVSAINLTMAAIIGNSAVSFGGAIPTATESVHLVEIARREVV